MKKRVQLFGRFLSGMVMPNIGAFIAWGLITALFIPVGWLPNEKLAALVGPMLTYLLPILIGFAGGRAIHDIRGGVVGAVATFGVIMGAPSTPMLLGAMIVGPLGGVVIKSFDKAVDGKIPAGFEMLVNNFSSGILGSIIAIIAFYAIGPMVEAGTSALGVGVSWLVNHGLLPLTSILVEPAKVLFLNNAINHGVFTPLGAEQVTEAGKSIFFMIESNPGPGLGLLLAYMLVGKGSAKSSAPGAAIIHFLGGIHEIYFPFVLMNPILIIAMIAGGSVGVFTISTLGGGLTGPAAPGSIFAELLMTPSGAYVANVAGISLSAVVTFALSVVLLKAFAKDADEGEDAMAEATAKMQDMKADAKGTASVTMAASAAEQVSEGASENVSGQASDQKRLIKKIIFACDAGMGSSAMGATKLRKKLSTAGFEGVEVKHSPVSEIPADADIVVTHNQLGERAAQANATAHLVLISNFLNAPEYDVLLSELKVEDGAVYRIV